jgi:prepilin-type N-terminal cleavage/methylation domain-containing protein
MSQKGRLEQITKTIEVKMRESDGFTLVEFLVAMVISLIVMSSIYSVYRSQQKSYVAQEQVAVMHQNLRAGMTMITKDIRTAGYDPTRSLGTGIILADSDQLQFSRIVESGSTDVETITYLYDSGTLTLRRNNQTVADNIEALDFVYLDSSGVTTASLPDIRAIQVTMVARTGKGDQGYVNSDIYYNQMGDQVYPPPGSPAPNDNIRRNSLTREIKCRNLGIGGS